MHSIGSDVFFLASLQSVEGLMIPSDAPSEWKESISLQVEEDPRLTPGIKLFMEVLVSLSRFLKLNKITDDVDLHVLAHLDGLESLTAAATIFSILETTLSQDLVFSARRAFSTKDENPPSDEMQPPFSSDSILSVAETYQRKDATPRKPNAHAINARASPIQGKHQTLNFEL
jgi:hypothetical protein